MFLKSKTNGAKTAAVGTEVIVMPDVGVDPLTVDYLFAKIDKDGNGKLSIRELGYVPSRGPEFGEDPRPGLQERHRGRGRRRVRRAGGLVHDLRLERRQGV